MKDRTAFHENVIFCRRLLGMTRQALADALEIPVTTVAGYETAGREPKFKTLVKLTNFFGVTADELIREPLKAETIEKVLAKKSDSIE